MALLLSIGLVTNSCRKYSDEIDPTVVDEKCGEKGFFHTVRTNPESPELGYVKLYNGGVENGKRIFIFEDAKTPENICPDEHTTAKFWVTFNPTVPPDFTFIGKAYWSLYGRQKTMTPEDGSTSTVHATLPDIGLKQAFDEDPGWIGLQVEASFPSQGDFATDSVHFFQTLHLIIMDYDYHEMK